MCGDGRIRPSRRAKLDEAKCDVPDATIHAMTRLLLVLFLTTFLTAQSATDVEITAEPHHHLVFANDQVHVFNVDVAPHTETLLHRHGHDYFYVMFGACEIVNAVQGKDPVNVKLRDAQVGFTPGAFAHVVRDLDQPFRNVTIELLQDDKLRHSTAKWDEDRGLEILHGGTQEILFVKDGVRASEFELQPGGTAPMPATGFLIVAVSDLRLEAADKPKNVPHSAWDSVDKKSGDSFWLPGGSVHALTNLGHDPAKFVTLEFP
jgi:quercetin dioxygenase-like cupin family protein